MKRLYPLFIIFAVVIVLYYPVLTTYFSQDDFFHFKVSRTDGTFLGFIKLFGFYKFEERGIAFYRPISREIPFNIYYSIFGLNPLPFRLLTMMIHLINIFLVYLLIEKLFHKKELSFFVSFFFGITAANVSLLYYLAGGIQTLLATTFTLSSILSFLKYLTTNRATFKLLSFLFFLLGISSHEQAIAIPFLIIGLIILKGSVTDLKKYALNLVIYLFVIFILIYMDIFKIGFSSKEQQYQAVFNIKTMANSLFWYMGWALGVPETLIDFVLPGFKLNPNLLKYWGKFYIFIFPSFFLSFLLIIISSIHLLVKKRNFFINKFFVFSLVWFNLGLLPVILLPLHKSTHYLTISLTPFWIMIGLIIFNFYQEFKNKTFMLARVFLIIFIVSLMILSSASVMLGNTNYWAATRGKLAKHLINNLQKTYPNLPKGSIIYFKNDPTYPFLTKEWGGSSKQASTVLNGSDAIQLLYKDQAIKVYYEDLKIPDLKEKNIYSLVAKIY